MKSIIIRVSIGLVLLAVVFAACDLNPVPMGQEAVVVEGFDGNEFLSTRAGIQYVGMRSSMYGMTDPYYWDSGTEHFSFPSGGDFDYGLSRMRNAAGVNRSGLLVWIMKKADSQSDHQQRLQYFSQHNILIIIQVEPTEDGEYPINAVSRLWNTYGSYSCVIGFGVDVEFSLTTAPDGNGMISAPDAVNLYKEMIRVSGGKWSYLMLKHWQHTYENNYYLPRINALLNHDPYLTQQDIGHFIFCNDGQDLGTCDDYVSWMVDKFALDYSNQYVNGKYYTAPIIFQVGYHPDWWVSSGSGNAGPLMPWFHTLDGDANGGPWDPSKIKTGDITTCGGIPGADRMTMYRALLDKLNQRIAAVVNNPAQLYGFVWVDFTVRRLLNLSYPYDDADNQLFDWTNQGNDLIKNGDFNLGTAHWMLTNEPGAAGSFTVTSGSNPFAQVTVTAQNSSPNTWDLQLVQETEGFQDKSYTLTFRAKASAPATVYIDAGYWDEVGQTWYTFTNDTEVPVSLTTSMSTHSVTLTLSDTQVAQGKGQLCLKMGKVARFVTVDFDDISLK